MNFPGLDPLWRGAHHTAHRLGLLRTWSLEEAHQELARGEKVLVVATTALGDSLLATPLLETLLRRLGPGCVSFLVRQPYADLYRDDPRGHRIFSVRGKYRWNALRHELRRDPHRLALLANLTEPDLIPYLWHGGVRGFLRYRSRWTRYPDWMANRGMLRRPDAPDHATGHAIENNLAMAGALGIEASVHELSLPGFPTNRSTEERILLLHPGASRPAKRWPVENWARLADLLAEKFEAAISLTGDREEVELAHEVARTMKHPATILAGKLSLRQLAGALSSAVAFFSGDTGPYHLAVAVRCPTMTLFAPTDRGSSLEACGPHQADPRLHRTLQTANLGDSIRTLSFARVAEESCALVDEALRQRSAL